MRVCFIAGTLGRGGAERQLLFMLESLAERKVELKLLSLTRGEAFETEVKQLGIDVEWVGRSERRLKRAFQVARSAAGWSADVIQSSHFYTNIYAGLAARFNRSVGIGAIRSDLTSEVAINGIYGKGQLMLPHHLIANSTVAVSRAVSLGISSGRIDYVPNVVRSPQGRTDVASNGNKSVRLSFVGRLSKEKRPDVFVALASRLSRELPGYDLSFTIAGDGPLRDEVARLADRETQSGTRISLVGELADPSTLYSDTDILVVTSQYEGTPNVILEAMAHGVPVIGPAVGGVPELVDEDRGFLVPPTDFEGFVTASKSLITDKSLRQLFGSRSRAFADETRSPARLADRLMAIYAKLLGNRE